MGGVEVYRADAPFDRRRRTYAAGTFVVPMTQVFARYAKDLLEQQTYPEVRRAPDSAGGPPYDVTAWSLGMQLGVDVRLRRGGAAAGHADDARRRPPHHAGQVAGNGPRFTFDYTGADTAIAINRLLKDGARLCVRASRSVVTVESVAARGAGGRSPSEFGLTVRHRRVVAGRSAQEPHRGRCATPRIGLYSPWTGGNIDEGWTRWVLEQYEFPFTTIHNERHPAAATCGGSSTRSSCPIRARAKWSTATAALTVRPEYRGGIGDAGIDNLARFVAEGGTLVTLGAASDFAIDRLPMPVRDLKRGTAARSAFRARHHPADPGRHHPSDRATAWRPTPSASTTTARSSRCSKGFNSLKPTVVARYPNQDIVASGWLRGEDAMVGRAAVVSVDMQPGRVVLFGLRPQHRAQTHATFPMLFNALYLSSTGDACQSPPISDSDPGHRRDVRQGIQRADRHAVLQGHPPARDAAARPLPPGSGDPAADDDRQPRDVRRSIGRRSSRHAGRRASRASW